MPNTHAVADFASELQASFEDLLPPCVITTTWPVAPVASMTLAAFATQAYVRDLHNLVYVDQPAITIALTGSDGTYWLGITRDVSTAYASWTRRPGSHYMWRLSGSRPPDVDGLLVFTSCTVAGGVITAVTPAPGVTRAEAWRSLSGLGTMATQNASAVAITGGTATLGAVTVTGIAQASSFEAVETAGEFQYALAGSKSAGPNRWNLYCNGAAANYLAGNLGLGVNNVSPFRQHLAYPKDSMFGLVIDQTVTDTGSNHPITFRNVAQTIIGSIGTTATATAYNTSSDVRLKHAIAPLTGALDVVRRLRPITHLWNADDSVGHNFLAHELMKEIPEAVSGLPDEVNPDGTIKPQQVDPSKLVVWLVGACQELLARLETLEAAAG